MWETATGKLLKSSPEAYTALAFSPGNECLATGDAEGWVCVRQLPDLNNMMEPFQEDHARIDCLALRNDLREAANATGTNHWLLAAGDADGTIRILRVPSRPVQAICRGSHYDNYALAFSPDGMTLASLGRSAKLWDIASGLPTKRRELPAGLVQKLCFVGNDRLLHFQLDNWNSVETRMCCLRDLFRADYRQPYAELPRVRDRLETAVLSPGGDFLAAAVGPAGPPFVLYFMYRPSGSPKMRPSSSSVISGGSANV